MKRKTDIAGEEQPREGRRMMKPDASLEERRRIVRDAAWEREKKWFEENRDLDPLALFAKYYQRF